MKREVGYHGNKDYLWPVAILVVALCITHGVAGGCDPNSEFRCANGTCVNISKVNNSVNDCGDNSDEVPSPCRPPAFSCLNADCVMPSWVLDGIDDCKDATSSDEAKIIGTSCHMVKDCCYCHDYVEHSHCHDNKTCQCNSGFYPNELGTVCIRRILKDSCTENSDCSDAFNNSICLEGKCGCDLGYYPSQDEKSCISRIVGDTCQESVDCTSVIANSNCTSDICSCKSGFYSSVDSKECIKRRIGDLCLSQSDCLDAVGNSQCQSGTCKCIYGYIVDNNQTSCRRRLLFDPCNTTWECVISIAGDSRCFHGYCLCYYGDMAVNEGRQCVTRVFGDPCKEDFDCSFAIKHSQCVNKVCGCSSDYLRAPDSRSCIYQYHKEDTAILASSVFIICTLSLAVVTVTVWLALKLFPSLKMI